MRGILSYFLFYAIMQKRRSSGASFPSSPPRPLSPDSSGSSHGYNAGMATHRAAFRVSNNVGGGLSRSDSGIEGSG